MKVSIGSEAVLAIALVGAAIIVPISMSIHKPTKYESYNEALYQCSTLKSENERNACRAEVTSLYREENGKSVRRNK